MIRIFPGFLISALSLLASSPGALPHGVSEKEIVLDAGEHSLESLIARASEVLKTNYVIAPESQGNLGQKIQCTARQSYTASEFRRFFEKVLIDRGFLLDPIQGIDGNQFRLVDLRANPLNRAMVAQNATVLSPAQVEALEGRAMVVTTTFALQYQDAQRIQGSLRQYVTDTQLERIFHIGNSSILVTSYPTTVLAIGKFLKSVDVAPSQELQEASTAQGLPLRVISLEGRVKELEKRLYEIEKK